MRLERLAAEFGDELEIEWKAYLLRPEPKPRTLEQFVTYTRHWSRPAEQEPAAQFGTWGDATPPSHSVPAAVAGKVAESFGKESFDRFKMAALQAYFRDCRTISDHQVLLDVARSAGIDAGEFVARWAGDIERFAEAVITDHNEALEAGVTGVPAVLVNTEYLLTGALALDDYRKVVRHLAG